MWRFFEFLNRWLYCFYDLGTLRVRSSGEYKIKTHFTPSEVFVAFDDDDHLPSICCAERDGFDIQIVPHGFVVVVKLNTDSRKLRWVAIR